MIALELRVFCIVKVGSNLNFKESNPENLFTFSIFQCLIIKNGGRL